MREIRGSQPNKPGQVPGLPYTEQRLDSAAGEASAQPAAYTGRL